MDLNTEPRTKVPGWSETRWNGCWNPAEGVGVYLHVGRYRHDLDHWWAQIVTYLPGGGLTVDRRWGRNANDAGLTLQDFDLTMTETGWTCSYDSVAQLTTTAELATGPRGSSAPVARVGVEIEAVGRHHEWDMYAGHDAIGEIAGDMHIQQSFSTTGTLRAGAERYRLDGIGFKDHSAGSRNIDGWYRHHYLMLVADSWTAHMLTMMPGPDAKSSLGVLMRDGTDTAITRFDMPELADSAGGPVHGPVVFELATGERHEFSSDLIHAMPVTITEDNDNINGIDWEIGGDPIVLIEGKGRLTASDGSVVYGFHERSARRSLVTRPR